MGKNHNLNLALPKCLLIFFEIKDMISVKTDTLKFRFNSICLVLLPCPCSAVLQGEAEGSSGFCPLSVEILGLARGTCVSKRGTYSFSRACQSTSADQTSCVWAGVEQSLEEHLQVMRLGSGSSVGFFSSVQSELTNQPHPMLDFPISPTT